MRAVQELFDLSGRVAIVTGGAGHIGSAIAHALAECGANIAIVDLDADRTKTTADAIAKMHGVTATAYPLDLEMEAQVREAPHEIEDRLGRLDILVNCAALVGSSGLTGWAVPFQEQETRSWQRALDVNLTAPFALIQESLPHLRVHGCGSIINVLSIYGLVGPDERLYEGTPMGNPAAYGASKAGLLQLTRHVATTQAPIRCNAITPGGVARGQADAFTSRYIARTPMARMAIEEDFKGAAAFLASDASAYVTGVNIPVDGGWTAW